MDEISTAPPPPQPPPPPIRPLPGEKYPGRPPGHDMTTDSLADIS